MNILRDRAVDKIHEAVEQAITAGMTPNDFIRKARESWATVLRDAWKDAAAQFDKATRS